MTSFEAGAILGVIGGAVAGAVLCKSLGLLAEVGGAIGGGVVGLFAGALLVFPISFAYGLARIYWEVLTGRRKLPSMSSQTKAHRRMMFKLMAVIFMVTAVLWTGLYFVEPDAVRSRLLGAVVPLLGTFFMGLLLLIVAYRRHPPRKDSEEFSANFDSEMVRPFLERIQPFIESGFGSAQIEQVCQVVATLPHDQEHTLEFQIRHVGKDARFDVRIFMDDIDAPDIYFLSPSALRQQIESEFHRFAEERGI
jgi:hypothetical protein